MSVPIIIVGAGVGGLALAQGLFNSGISFQLYERDASLLARSQGYRFRISDQGITGLKQNLTKTQFERLKNACICLTSTSNVPFAFLDAISGQPGPSPFAPFGPGKGLPRSPLDLVSPPWSADRAVLRSVLIEGIEQHVHFGKAFESFQETEEGVTVKFTDGSAVHGRMLIGADGAWSKVRRELLPGFRLLDTEGRLIFGKTDMTDKFLAQFSPEACKGLTLVRKPGLGCLLEPMRFNTDAAHVPLDYVYWVLFLHANDFSETDDPLLLSADETAELALELTKDWDESFRCLFTSANKGQTAMYRVVSAPPPISITARPNTSVTLMGDAIHPMAPTAALGANTALQDAGLLVKLLSQDPPMPLSEMINVYEEEMANYSTEVIRKTLFGGKGMWGMKPFEELPEIDVQQ